MSTSTIIDYHLELSIVHPRACGNRTCSSHHVDTHRLQQPSSTLQLADSKQSQQLQLPRGLRTPREIHPSRQRAMKTDFSALYSIRTNFGWISQSPLRQTRHVHEKACFKIGTSHSHQASTNSPRPPCRNVETLSPKWWQHRVRRITSRYLEIWIV